MGDEVRRIGDICRHNVSLHPEREAVVDGDRRLSWAELLERTDRLADGLLHQAGVAPGDRVGFIGDNCLEIFELLHAGPRAGIIVVPFNHRLAAAELRAITESVSPRILFHTPAERERASVLADATGAQRIEVASAASSTYEDLIAAGRPVHPDVEVAPESVSSICFTSGTTGQPKGVLMRNGAQIAFARGQRDTEPIGDAARHLFLRPVAVAPGHRMTAWHGLYCGTTVILPRFAASTFFDVVETERITNVLLAPTTLRMLIDDGNPAKADLGSLRTIAYGGAPMTPELLAEVVEFFDCDLFQGYGSSEAGQALYLSPEDHRNGKLRSNGWPIPGVEVEIRVPGTSELVESGSGELCVRSEQLMAGYWRNPEETARALRDGWYVTGDLAERDPDGSYRIVGRVKEMIISGGFNIIPSEVEGVLMGHPCVREVSVYGVPDRKWGESVEAAVVLEPGQSVGVDELLACCREQLASFKKPQRIVFVEALPLTSAGKVDKVALREAAIAASSGSGS